MKHYLLSVPVLAAVILTAAVSCSKSLSDSSVDPESEDTFVCAHDSLIFVAAEEPGETECGCVEHYYCPQCSRYFADAGCIEEIESPILWGTTLELGMEDYYTIFEEAYTESGYDALLQDGGESNFILSILNSIIVDQATKAFDKLFGFTDDNGDVNPVFKEISDNLSKIENAILGMTQMFKEEKIKDFMNDRQKNLFYVRNATHPSFMAVLRQLKGCRKPKEGESAIDVIPKANMDVIRTIVTDWYGSGIYNGLAYEDCYIKVSELMHFFNGYWTSSKTIPELYDCVALRSTPWFHESAHFRRMTRYSDAITLAEAYLMNCLYFHFKNDLASPEKIKLMSDELKGYDKLLDKHKIDDGFMQDSLYTRWTWENKSKEMDISRFKLYRDIWDFQESGDYILLIDNCLNDFIKKKTSWHYLEPLKEIYISTADARNRYGLTKAQQQVIWDYYKKSYGNSYYDMLKRAGFRGLFEDGSYSGTYEYCRLVCDCPEIKDNNFVKRYHWLWVEARSKTGLLGFRNVLKPDFTFYPEGRNNDNTIYRDEMDWATYNNQWPLELRKIGFRKASYHFMALTRTGDELPPM